MLKTGPGWKYFYTVMDCGLILGKTGVSLAKVAALTVFLGVCLGLEMNLGRWIFIGRSRGKRRAGRRRESPETSSRGRATPELAKSAFPGSNRPGLGSGKMSIACVIHLDTRLGLRRVGAARATAAVGLRGEARRRRAFGPCQCRAVGAKGAGSTRKARHTF